MDNYLLQKSYHTHTELDCSVNLYFWDRDSLYNLKMLIYSQSDTTFRAPILNLKVDIIKEENLNILGGYKIVLITFSCFIIKY